MIVAQHWGSDVVFPSEIFQWGPWVALAFVALFLGIPIFRARMEARDKADQARRDKADEVDQVRREAADKERREGQALLLQHLQAAADKAEQRLDAQSKEFLGALERRDKQYSEDQRAVASALRDLTTAVDSLQRRPQR